MPGLHSHAAREARRQRAIERGFLRASVDMSRRIIEVDAEVAPRLKVVAKSLSIQHRHNAALGIGEPYARKATRGVRALPSDSDYKRSMNIHDNANQAKHSWPVSDASASGEVKACWANTVDDHDFPTLSASSRRVAAQIPRPFVATRGGSSCVNQVPQRRTGV